MGGTAINVGNPHIIFFVENLNDYDEILIVGSGKGVVSVSSIEKNLWRRKSTKLFNKLVKIYKSEVKK